MTSPVIVRWHSKPGNRLFLFLLLTGLIYSLVSFPNHYLFRTYALDLGVYNHALFSFSRFRESIFTLGIEGYDISYWGTHFSPLTLIYIPVYLLLGSYSLLVIQITAILGGGFGIYKYSRLKKVPENLSLLLVVAFSGMWGIYSALSFDFHNTVVAAMILPWFFYFMEKRNLLATVLTFITIIIAQENTALWMIFILTGIIIRDLIRKNYRENTRVFFFHVLLLLFSIIYFIVVVQVLMPAFNNRTDLFYRYSDFGNSFTEIISSIIKKPLHALKLLFISPSEDPVTHGIKGELHIMVLLAGGIFMLYKPYYLIMLLPVYAQKMFSNDPVLWGINMQYSIEFVPVLGLCLVDTFATMKFRRSVIYGIVLTIILSVYGSTMFKITSRRSIWYDNTNSAFWMNKHYTSGLDLKEVYSTMKLIQGRRSVSASSPLVPHLAGRYRIYQFPVVRDADYVMLFKGERGIYPLGADALQSAIDSLKCSATFEVLNENNDIILFERKQ